MLYFYVEDIFSRQYIFRLSKPPWKKKRLLSFCTESSSHEEEGKKKALDAVEGVEESEGLSSALKLIMIFHLFKSPLMVPQGL